ncbi:MAG: AMP-binding protein [Aquificaceae bacterium]
MELDLEKATVVPKLKDWKKTALVYKGIEISYFELIERIKAFSYLLDIAPDEKVVIISENCPEWVCAFFSIWQRGGIVVPVDFMSSPEEIEYILAEVEPSALFYSDLTWTGVSKALEKLKIKPQLYNLDRIAFQEKLENHSVRSIHHTAVILYTSGTTGQPKGVMLSFKNLISNIKAIEKLGIATKEDVTVALLPFHHAYPLMVTLLVPLHIGASIVFLEKLSSEELMNVLKRHGVTILVGVPRLYQLLQKRIIERLTSSVLGRVLFELSWWIPEKFRKLLFWKVHKAFGGRLKLLVSGGAKLPVDTAQDFHRLGFKVIEGYGLTETSPIVSFNPPWKVKLGSVGIPIEEVHVKIDKDGEVLVRGVNVMQGYYKKPDETERAFVDGYLATGDLGYMDEDGYLYITGRKKEVIVLSGGKNVNPEELENLMTGMGDVVKEVGILEANGLLNALIFPDMEKVKERRIINLHEYIKWSVIDKLNRSLPEWKRITGFKLVDRELPKTRLGKIRRFLLPKIYASTEEKKEEREEDRELLALSEWKVLSNYIFKLSGKVPTPSDHIEIDLGLDSLAKVELLSFIENSFGVSMSEEELLDHIVLRELIRFILERKEKAEFTYVDWGKILKESIPFKLEDYPILLKAGCMILRFIFTLYNRIEVKGINNLPNAPFILAPNHASYLDGFVLASALPYEITKLTYFLGEEHYFKNPITSIFGKLAHVITVNLDRKLKESLQKTAWALRIGKVVVIFPEGARTRDGKLLPFKRGFAILSKELGVPVVPVALVGTYQSLSLKDRFPKPKKIKVVFGKPIYPDDKTYDGITEEVRAQVDTLLKEELFKMKV